MRTCLLNWIEQGLAKKVPGAGLGLFRIFFGLVILQEIAHLFYFRHLIFDPLPFIDEANPILPIALAVWFCVALFLTAGLFTRLCCIANYAFWVVFVLMTPMWHDFDGGFDQLMTSSSLLLILVRSERRFSLDRLRMQLRFAHCPPMPPLEPCVPVIDYYLLAGVSLGLLYFDAALHKLHSQIWLNGLGVWVPNTVPYYISPLDFDWFLNQFRLQQLIGYSLFLFQFTFIFVFTRRLFRIPLAIFGILFHLGILFCLNIYPFGLGMLAHYVLLVPFRCFNFLADKLQRTTPVFATYCNTKDPVSVRTALISRHFDVRNFSTYHFVSNVDELPEILRHRYPNFETFTIASLDCNNRILHGPDGLPHNRYRRLLFFCARCIEFADTGFRAVLLLVYRVRKAVRGYFKSVNHKATQAACAHSREDGKLSARLILRYLAIVLILQFNSTFYYAILKNLGLNEPSTAAGKFLHDFSTNLTSLSHVFFGITPHALYMDNHFSDYRFITSMAYLDAFGHERWLPFIAPDGRMLSPHWGRVHSMWANVAMHPPFNPKEFERLAAKVTAFWAEKLGIATQDSTFIIYSKPVEISLRWVKDLRKNNLSGMWSKFATIRWKNSRFSIEYRSRWLSTRSIQAKDSSSKEPLRKVTQGSPHVLQ